MTLEISNQKHSLLVSLCGWQFLRFGPSEWKGGDVLDHHNSVHYNIQLTMEMERDSHFSCLETNIYRNWRAHIAIRITISPLRLTYI